MTMHMTQSLVLWGLIATVAMASILHASQGLGFSRLSLPFLLGSAFSANRSTATVLGFVLYVLGGWLFAFLYFLFFTSVGIYAWWLGAIVGVIHGAFLLVCVIPLLPYVHPRMDGRLCADSPRHDQLTYRCIPNHPANDTQMIDSTHVKAWRLSRNMPET